MGYLCLHPAIVPPSFQVSLSCKNGIYHHRRTNHYPSWVFSHSTDYVELYRVVDYQQSRSLPQQLFGLKTVTIYSGDRNNAKLDMIGIKASNDIVSEIRCRVEFNKKTKEYMKSQIVRKIFVPHFVGHFVQRTSVRTRSVLLQSN